MCGLYIVRLAKGRGGTIGVPSWTRFMSYMIEAKIMQDHTVPITLLELPRDVSCNIIVDFRKVLHFIQLV